MWHLQNTIDSRLQRQDKKQATVTGTQIEGGWESVNTFNDSNIILEHFVTEFSGINHS